MEERLYDLIFICAPLTPEEDVTKLTDTLEHTVTEQGGKVEKKENWGTKRLAYRVAKNREGIFVYLQFKSTHGEVIKELERRLKVAEPVIKYQTIRLDEEMKLQKKLQDKREKKLARRPRRAAPAAAAPAAPATPAPAAPEQPAA
jgi:small subunit ribosomal protein S6